MLGSYLFLQENKNVLSVNRLKYAELIFFYLISNQEFAQEYHPAAEFFLNQIFQNINERAVSVRTGYTVFSI